MAGDLLPNWLTRCAENRPNHLAVQCEGISWSFAELDWQTTRLARQLAMLSVQEGSRVALLATNSVWYVTCVHALTRLGAVFVPLNVRLTVDELCWQICDVRATLLLHDATYAACATEIRRQLPDLPLATLADEPKSGEVALRGCPVADVVMRSLTDLNATQAILYTSGTTGRPKGALITYGMQWWSAVGSALNLGHNRDDRWLACMPLFHIGGLAILMRSVIYSMSVVVQQKFDAVAVNTAIFEEKITIISVVPTMLQRMLTANTVPYPSTLRCVLLSGGAVPQPLLEDCVQRTIPVVQAYGLTESCSQAVALAPEDVLRKVGSAGRPLAPVQLSIMHDGQLLPVGEQGEICLKGPNITPGYADHPEETVAAFRDGWLATGDLGYLDEEGYLYVLGRRVDLIISGGENIYPAEIEAVLLTHPDVEEAAVCGRDDPYWGQVPIAFVILKAGKVFSLEQLRDYSRKRLAGYKQPKAIYAVDHFPRNASGKLLRHELFTLLPEGG